MHNDVWGWAEILPLMFAKKRHPKTLADAETWYVNWTLNVVQKPFMQLLTINSFIKSGENVNQVPLVI